MRLVFSPDGRTLAVGCWSGRLGLYDAATGDELAGWTAHHSEIGSLVFTPDGRTLVSSGVYLIRLWDVPAELRAASKRVVTYLRCTSKAGCRRTTPVNPGSVSRSRVRSWTTWGCSAV
jgi:WD40 repeat protein